MKRWIALLVLPAALAARTAHADEGVEDGAQPAADGAQPAADRAQPAAEVRERTADTGQPTADSAQPAADSRPASLTGFRVGVAGRPPGKKDRADKPPRDLRAGPLVGVGVPGGIEAGAVMIYQRILGAGLQIGTVPSMRVPGVPHGARVTRYSAEASARVYPLKGALFLGAGIGYAHLEATLDQRFTGYGVSAPGQVRAELSSVYVRPEIGFLWKWDVGLMLGADLGVVVPVAARESHVTAAAGGQTMEVKGKVADVFSTAGRVPLPALGLLRVGWLI